jgi:calpain-15
MELGNLGKYIISSSVLAGLSEENPLDILYQCQINNEKYVDREFPIIFSSLSGLLEASSKYKYWSKYRWVRISEFVDPIRIFNDHVSPLDITQGALRNYNFLCSISCLAEIPGFIENLFVTKENAYGFYSVKVCRDGVWKNIIVDDYIPCGKDSNTLCFSQTLGGEVWVSVLEKVWAKVKGSYENTELCSISDCLRDLTGAPARVLFCNKILWEEVVTSISKNYIICASASSNSSSQKLLESMGLIGSLAYAVLRVAEVPDKIVKLRNPWSKVEWNGDWSDKSAKWTEALKQQLQLTQVEDGTFWMSFKDFIEYFSYVTICETVPNNFYTSISITHDIGNYTVLSFQITSRGEYTISCDQKDKLYMSTLGDYKYSSARIVICRDTKDGLKYILGFRGLERNLFKKIQLKRGSYMVFVMVDWESNERDAVISAYGPSNVDFQDLGKLDGFLENLYKDKAIDTGSCLNYETLSLPGCCKYHEILPEEFGYYYIVNNNPKLTLNETTYFKKFKNLALMPPYSGNKYTVSVPPNSEYIILFKTITSNKYAIETSSTFSITGPDEILVINE